MLSLGKKLLLFFLFVIMVVSFTTNFTYPIHPDHYYLGQYTYAVMQSGYAPWILHPSSLIGYYPLSVPSGFEFFFSVLSFLSNTDLPELFYYASIFSALFAAIGIYLVMREFQPFEVSFITSIMLTTTVLFVRNISNNASSRMFNIIFYPVFILLLFKVYRINKERKTFSWRYALTIFVLFIFMNLVHRFGQLLFIFILSFFVALFLENFTNLLEWAKKKEILKFRKAVYEIHPLYVYIDLEVITLIIISFSIIKINLIWIILTFVILTHYSWFNLFKHRDYLRTENKLLLDVFSYIFYVIIFKCIDLLIRGRLSKNFTRIAAQYSFQFTIIGIGIGLIILILTFLFFKNYKNIRKFLMHLKSQYVATFWNDPLKLISLFLFLLMMFLISRNFTGGNFYKSGLDHYTESFLLKGTTPWVILINFVFNLSNNLTILIYFAFIGIGYLFLKDKKSFYDYFFILVAVGFSQFLLDWEYVRLYMIPIYSIFIGIGISLIVKNLQKKFSISVVFSILLILLVAHLIVSNIFIQREHFIEKFGYGKFDEIPEQNFIKAGDFIRNNGNISIHTSSSIDYDSKTAYYARKVNSVIAASVFFENKEYNVEQINISDIWNDFKSGRKIRQFYNLKDPIFGSNYYIGRHISFLNKRKINDNTVASIINYYNIKFIIDSPDSGAKTKFFESISDIKNKIYSSGKIDIYDLEHGR